MVSYSMNLSNIREREEGYRSCMSENGLGEYVGFTTCVMNAWSGLWRCCAMRRRAAGRGLCLCDQYALAMQGVTAMFRNRLADSARFFDGLFRYGTKRSIFTGRRRRRVSQPIELRGRGAGSVDQEHRTQGISRWPVHGSYWLLKLWSMMSTIWLKQKSW